MAVVVRDLEEADREDVLEISKHIWDGHDYVPYTIDVWLMDEDCLTLDPVSRRPMMTVYTPLDTHARARKTP